ncbi:hypothetical protein HQN89_36030 [Paenibacillus frigoriresistens]|uniref:hypothetical protein n=1 Tax=Paenibacillus alginolyticus TaxID=59839 RepID=UPI00156573EC|nr:hypothetical protein [Paenibacillus frigoriresistens]NRF96181.1 hypothetical protein [Paenibacillus frigoriresistens]
MNTNLKKNKRPNRTIQRIKTKEKVKSILFFIQFFGIIAVIVVGALFLFGALLKSCAPDHSSDLKYSIASYYKKNYNLNASADDIEIFDSKSGGKLAGIRIGYSDSFYMLYRPKDSMTFQTLNGLAIGKFSNTNKYSGEDASQLIAEFQDKVGHK